MKAMKKIYQILILVLVLSLTTAPSIFAKRLLPQLRSAAGAKIGTASSGKGRVTTSVKFRGDRRAINVTLNNLNVATRINYLLSYNTKGTMQGASGSIDLSLVGGNSITRELLFGNCSKGACRYDAGITNAKLTITSTLLNGQRVVKRYRLKV